MKMLIQSMLLAGILMTGACAKEDTTDDTTTTAASVQKDVAYASVSSAVIRRRYLKSGFVLPLAKSKNYETTKD